MAGGMSDEMACDVFSARDDEGGLCCDFSFSFGFQNGREIWRRRKPMSKVLQKSTHYG